MKRVLKIIGCFTAMIVALIIASYIGLSYYYRGVFSYGSWYNGVYCTGKTVDEVNAILTDRHDRKSILVIEDGAKSEEINFQDAGISFSFEKVLQEEKDSQNPWTWVLRILRLGPYETIEPDFAIDERVFEQAVCGLNPMKTRKPDDAYAVRIIHTKDGYTLQNDRVHVLDQEAVKTQIREAILAGKDSISLEESGCYKDLPLSDEMLAKIDLFDKVNAFQNCGISYRFGDEVINISANDVSKWLILDENGDFTFDENGELAWDPALLTAFVDSFLEPYNTFGGVRRFQTTRGDTVTIKGGTYGNLIDMKAEREYLLKAFSEGIQEEHEPKYLRECKGKGLNDIGDTYIEIDMGNQILYYYQNDELIISTPIVTGNMMRRRNTPSAVCYVYGKQKNRTLRGPGYASFVHFWMPVKNGIGIHDAPWRDTFGGEIYKRDGSHGCINTPYEPMERLYELTEIGTPVVMFY
ncbi:MAG: L,D-transpeptidase/peptidoglycan binding protein [Lachnospiraceae bacterium]|nr:L,D-transpeptidase/peptidoglycan binding protein [Lachnospiraceae bacterium]